MKKKRLISAVSIFCLTVILFSGCGKKQNHGLNPNEPTTITIWHYYNGVQQENFDNMILEFNETVGHEQGIVVKARSKGSISDLADSVLASLRQDADAETAPDMFAAYAETAYIADRMGCVVDLTQYFTEEELAEYVSGYLAEGNLNEESGLKIFPTAKSTEVMMLNLTDWQTFAKAKGVSVEALSTWEGLAETAEKYYEYTDALTPDVPNDGKAFFGRDSVANYMLVGAKQLGQEFFAAENGNVTIHTDEEMIRRLWDCYYVPYVKGFYCSSRRFRSDDAKVGIIIAMVCSTTGAAYFPEAVTLNDEYTYPIEGLVLSVPNFKGTEPYVVQQGAGMVVVKSEEKKEYACSVFLKWFTEKERSIAFSVNSGYLPVKKEANDFSAISAGFQTEGNTGNNALLSAMETAVSEINSYQLYAAKPYEKSAQARDFLDTYIQQTAQTAHDAAASRIKNGENREDVLSEYVSDEAFNSWYADFVSGLQKAGGI
ncbi:MAG: extracellular solute-binding protein [Lachnospiraceae bacterium]|nr:extracellular solute-binding protein [Lachnospiraceae bacterium]